MLIARRAAQLGTRATHSASTIRALATGVTSSSASAANAVAGHKLATAKAASMFGPPPPRPNFGPTTPPTLMQRLATAMRTSVALPMVGSLTVSEMFGHAAFLLSGTAFLDTDILNLRILSVASGGATLVFAYFHPVGHPLWLPFGWNLVFMLINGGHIYRIVSERREAERLPAAALSLWHGVFEHHGVSAVDFAKLLAAGTWATLRKGATLQQEGQPSNSVFLIVRGGADVAVGKRAPSYSVYEQQFIGDMGLSSGIDIPRPVRGVATVTTNQQTTCLVWTREKLCELLEGSPRLAASFHAAVSADVMRKFQDPSRDPGGSDAAALWRGRYASVLEAVLSTGEVSDRPRAWELPPHQ